MSLFFGSGQVESSPGFDCCVCHIYKYNVEKEIANSWLSIFSHNELHSFTSLQDMLHNLQIPSIEIQRELQVDRLWYQYNWSISGKTIQTG